MANWTNDDGMLVQFGNQDTADQGLTSAVTRRVIVDITGTDVASSAPVPGAYDPSIPAGAYITKAYIISETTFTSGGAATLTVGLQESDGTAIDADGIDAAIAIAALTAGDVVLCDGALAGGVLTVGSEDAYVSMLYGTAAYTAGAAKLVIEYIEV